MMMETLFDPEPEKWGLRGDPWVWRAMRERLAGTPVPAAAAEVRSMLQATFTELVGVDLATEQEEMVYRPEFAHGGMSSGHVHMPTWRTRLMPLLESRANR